MIEIKSCPICGAELQPNAKHFTGKPFFTADVGVSFNVTAFIIYSLCPNCGVFVQSPRMNDEDIHKYYADGMYRAWLGVSPAILDIDEDKRADMDASLLRALLGPIQSHLDIGSSRGDFLKYMGAEHQDGIEPNQDYNQNNLAEIFPDLEQIDGLYDLVSAIHSMEHSTNPGQMLRDMSSLSKKYVVVEVPSDKSPGGWGRLAHTFHFPEETIAYMAEKVGLKIIAIVHTPHTLVVMEKFGK
jgi:hypothetical protein